MNAAVIDEKWEIEFNDFLKGDHSPEQISAELINTDRQEDGSWCNGYAILDELKKMGLMPAGQAASPEHFLDEWKGKEVAILGTRYVLKSKHSRIAAIRVYTWDDEKCAWNYRMKHMDSEFGIRVQRNANLRILVFKILG